MLRGCKRMDISKPCSETIVLVRAIPTSDGNARMPSGHSRRTTELGRVEWQIIASVTDVTYSQRRMAN
jgi:hypothetical protein